MLTLDTKYRYNYVTNNNCKAYTSLGSIVSNHRITKANIKLSLRAYKKKHNKYVAYDCSTLNRDTEIRNTFIISLKNRNFNFPKVSDTTLSKSSRYTNSEKPSANEQPIK